MARAAAPSLLPLQLLEQHGRQPVAAMAAAAAAAALQQQLHICAMQLRTNCRHEGWDATLFWGADLPLHPRPSAQLQPRDG